MSAIRSLARNVAKVKMKQNGMTRICSKRNLKGERSDSKFSRNWKKEVNWR